MEIRKCNMLRAFECSIVGVQLPTVVEYQTMASIVRNSVVQ